MDIMLKRLLRAISTVGGLGYFPYAPGTAGSAAGLFFCVILRDHPEIYFWLFLTLFLTGVAASGRFERETGIKDPSCVVIDEFAGIFVVFFWIPITLFTAFAGFALFRFFDVFKPPPLRSIEKVGGGWGIMLDDLVAGVFANTLLRFILLFKAAL